MAQGKSTIAYIGIALSVVGSVVGAVSWLWGHGLKIHDNELRSQRNEECIGSLSEVTKNVEVRIGRVVTIQEAQTKQLDKIDSKIDRMFVMMRRKPAGPNE